MGPLSLLFSSRCLRLCLSFFLSFSLASSRGYQAAPSSSSTSAASSSRSNSSSATSNRVFEILLILARLLVWPLRRLLEAVFPSGDLDGLSPAVCAKAATEFTALVNHHPHLWLQVGFAAAKQEALDTSSLLLVYLHSPLHPKGNVFLNTFSATLHNLLGGNEQVLAVGFSIHTAQGLQLAQVFRATSYPFVALVQTPLNGRNNTGSSSNSSSSTSRNNGPTTLNLLLRAEGPSLLEWKLDHFIAHIQASLTRHQVLVAEATARRLQQAEETALRQQQDEEYQQALQQDQQREKDEQIKAQQVAREQQRRIDRLRNAQQMMRNNNNDTSSSGRTANIRFVLPSGVKLNQRFGASQSIGILFAYLVVHFHENDIPIEHIGLSTSFPRNTLEESDPRTLEEAELLPQAVLMVQDLDA